MCFHFRKINELQPKTQRVDKQTNTQGNLSLIPLPKIAEMYANLCGTRIFTTLELWSGYYHIGLDKESKAKTAFLPLLVNMNLMLFHWFGTSPCLFSAINFKGLTGL